VGHRDRLIGRRRDLSLNGLVEISAEVRAQALEFTACGPDPPAELGMQRITTPHYVLMVTPMPSVTFVDRLRLEGADIEAVVAEVREVIRGLGRTQATWLVGPMSTPPGLADALRGLGFVPHTEPPLEPTATCLAIVGAPDADVPPGIEIRLADSAELLADAYEVSARAFGMSTEDGEALAATIPTRLRLQEEGSLRLRDWIAYVDGKPAAAARGSLVEHGINLSGAAVLPEGRGRGLYRALIAERWREAVERGTPALTVQAGEMSAPILRKLGFVEVGTAMCLLDRLEPA
jgi:GNAT superfamily N-acetyltransferase